jgi:hypothetical protein
MPRNGHRHTDFTTRPTKYRAEFCDLLEKHMAQGYSFKSFGAVAKVSEETLHVWKHRHKAFREAHERAKCIAEKHLIDVGRAMATGQLKTVISETVILDGNNRPIYGSDGKPLTNKVYAPAKGNAAVWIVMMKNICGWEREPKRVELSGPDGAAVRVDAHRLTPEERRAECDRLAKRRAECGDD